MIVEHSNYILYINEHLQSETRECCGNILVTKLSRTLIENKSYLYLWKKIDSDQYPI